MSGEYGLALEARLNLACVTRDLFRSSTWSVLGRVWESAPEGTLRSAACGTEGLAAGKLRSNLSAGFSRPGESAGFQNRVTRQ